MGKYYKGSVGKTISYKLNGRLVERRVGVNTTATSPAQLAHRTKLKIINAFLGPIEGFIEFGFALEGKVMGMNAHNAFTSYSYYNCVKGEYPFQEMDFPKVMLSMGILPLPDDLAVSAENHQIAFSWDPQLLSDDMRWSDHAMLMAYCPEKKSAHYLINGPVRKLGSGSIDVPRYRNAVTYHLYIGFISDDHKQISDSTYLGILQM